MEYVRKLLEEIGLEGRRIQMINISSAMGGQFAFAAAEMTAEIKQLGPSPLRAQNAPRDGIDDALKTQEEVALGDTSTAALGDAA